MRNVGLGLETESLHIFFQHNKIDIFDFVDITKDIGLDGVSINIIPDLNLNQRFGTLSSNNDDYLKRLNDKLLSNNLFCEIDTRWTEYELLKEDLRISKMLNAKVMRSYLRVKDYLKSEDIKKAISDIRAILPLLEEYQITLALENHEFETADDLLKIVGEIDSEFVGVLYDTGNSMMVRKDPIDEVKKLLPYIKTTHFKDHVVCLNENEPVISGEVLGAGSIDCKEMFKLLVDNTKANINLETCYPYSATIKDPMIAQKRIQGQSITKELLESDGFRFKGVFEIKQPPLKKQIKPLEYYYPHKISQKMTDDLMEIQLDCVKKSVKYLKELRKNYIEGR